MEQKGTSTFHRHHQLHSHSHMFHRHHPLHSHSHKQQGSYFNKHNLHHYVYHHEPKQQLTPDSM